MRIWIARDNYRRHREHVIAEEDVAYGAHTKQKIDFFLPRERASALIAFIHGGAWKIRDRRFHRAWLGLYSNVGMALARRGIASAILGYRQQPDDVRPSIDDLHAALEWIAARRSEALVLMGHSAGAHLASWLALDPARKHACRGLVLMGGFYDVPRFLAAMPRLPRLRAHRLLGAAASPERWVTASAPPLLVAIAQHDAPSLNAEQRHLLSAYQQAGATSDAFQVDTGHVGLVLQMGRTKDLVSDRIAERAKAWCTGSASSRTGDGTPERTR